MLPGITRPESSRVVSADPTPMQLENSEAVVTETLREFGIVQVPSSLDSKEVLVQRLRDWAHSMESSLNREIG
jgi:hypothetical protein